MKQNLGHDFSFLLVSCVTLHKEVKACLGSGGRLHIETEPSPRPLPAVGSALARRLAVLGEPLPADVLHHRVLRLLCCLEDLLDQRPGLARLQFHRQQVRRPQLTAQQVGFDLWAEQQQA